MKRGEVMGVVGGSGTGKSVLLRSIIGLNRPGGSIKVFGEETVGRMPTICSTLQMRWGVLFQEGALFSSQTVAENIQVPMREYTDMSQELMNEIASMKLSMVGLPEDTAKKYPSELSGGMKKRAGLARALALDPDCCSWTSRPRGSIRFPPIISTSWCAICRKASASPSSW